VLALEGAASADPADFGSVHVILADDAYRFCHEADYPLTTEEHAWCPIVGKSPEDCPTLPAACARPPIPGSRRALPLSRRGGRGGRGTRGGDASARDGRKRDAGDAAESRRPRDDDRSRPEPETTVTLPDLSWPARFLMLALLVGFLAAVTRAVAQNFVRGRADDAPPEPPPPVPAAPSEGARGPVETDVERLLARARALAARGEYARAIDDTYAALLRRLDGDGLIDIHPSRTNGDYVRQLRDRPELRSAVRDIVGEVERVQFGATAPSEGAFRSVIARVAPLVGRALGAALLCLGLSAVLSCSPHQSDGGDLHADTSPSGTQAIRSMLGRRGIKVTQRSAPLEQVDQPGTLVLLPGVEPDEATWAHLLAWVHDKGGSLIIAGPEVLPAELGLRITPGGVGDAVTVAPTLTYTLGEHTLALPEGWRLEQTGPGTLDGIFLLRADAVHAVLRPWGGGSLKVFADGALFTNVALAAGGNAAFLTQLFEHSPRPIELADAWTGAGAATPLESVRRAELTPVVVQLFVLLALLYLWKGLPFARLRDPPVETRRAFADHARALGVGYARARASRHVLGLYSVWALERLRERVHRSGREGLIPLAEAIAARTGQSEAEVMRVLTDAAGAREEAAPPSSFRPRGAPAARARRDEVAADLALMDELSRFLTATGQRRPARRSRTLPRNI
jgi:hypothetical protein